MRCPEQGDSNIRALLESAGRREAVKLKQVPSFKEKLLCPLEIKGESVD